MTDRFWVSSTPTKTALVDPPRKMNRWYEASTAHRRFENRIHDRRVLAGYIPLAPGVLVIWDRKPWRVIEVRELAADLWPDPYPQRYAADLAAWNRHPHGDRPEHATWRRRPVNVVLAPDREPKGQPLHLIGPADHRWEALPEHYAICVACGELPPCRHQIADREADRRMARAEVLMEIPPGHCLGCGEPITSRQKAIRFPGENLWRPDLGDGSAVFHARRECSGEVYVYRRQFEERGGQDPQPQLPIDTGGDR